MTEDKMVHNLVLASLRAQMGDWTYYITFMKMGDLARRINATQLVYASKPLQELLQRQVLKNRTQEISNYLRNQKQRFFNALVVGTSGGDPKWHETIITNKPPGLGFELPGYLDGTLGFLILDGSEELFTIDGQHRVAGIREAIKHDPKLKEEEVCVILVRGITAVRRHEDGEGFEKTRRLFTTLNRYAKPVSKKDIIALDEDDSVAIITRRLLEDYPLFSGTKISIKAAKSIPVGDKQSFTSIITLYDVLDVYLSAGTKGQWKKFKRFRPGTEEEINELYYRASSLWDTYCKHFTSLQELKDSDPDEEVAKKYRHREGGHILFRPIGLLMSIKVVRNLMDYNEFPQEKAVLSLSKVPAELSGHPWSGLLWDHDRKRMIAASENQRAAEKLLFHSVGGDLNSLKTDDDALRTQLASLLKVDVSDVALPKYS